MQDVSKLLGKSCCGYKPPPPIVGAPILNPVKSYFDPPKVTPPPTPPIPSVPDGQEQKQRVP